MPGGRSRPPELVVRGRPRYETIPARSRQAAGGGDPDGLQRGRRPGPASRDDFPDGRRRIAVNEALDRLPASQREVLVLLLGADLDEAAIARIAKCPVGTVRRRRRLGKAALQRALDPSPDRTIARRTGCEGSRRLTPAGSCRQCIAGGSRRSDALTRTFLRDAAKPWQTATRSPGPAPRRATPRTGRRSPIRSTVGSRASSGSFMRTC